MLAGAGDETAGTLNFILQNIMILLVVYDFTQPMVQ